MPLNGHHILLVEDDFHTAFDVKRIVREAHGEVVAHAASLAKAMKLAATPHLSLAILDFSLGSNNSLRVAAKLRAFGVPFIFHTGSDLSVLSKAWPDVPVVAKPADPDRLVRTLASVAGGYGSGWVSGLKLYGG